MVRVLVLLTVLAACGSERTPLTSKVTTLGYSHRPAVVVVGRGTEDLVRPWMEGLRASNNVNVIAELVLSPDEDHSEAATCQVAIEAAKEAPVEEIIVIQPVQTDERRTPCSSYGTSGSCTQYSPPERHVRVTTIATAYRASTCKRVRQTAMPLATGVSYRSPDVGPATAEDEETVPLDLKEAHDQAVEQVQTLAREVSWNVFPRDSSIQNVDGRRIVIAGPLELRDYLVKTPSSSELVPGVRAVERTFNQTTLDVGVLALEPGDELHAVTDMVTVVSYLSVSGGIANANGTKHGMGGGALAARWSWDHKPWMFDTQLGGDVVPGVDSSVFTFSVAGGLRFPYWITPVAFVDLGIGGAMQGDDGARAAVGHAGIGGGIEIRRARWFAFADVRLRGVALSDWKDSDDKPVAVDYPDGTWRTTTGQLGVGFHH